MSFLKTMKGQAIEAGAVVADWPKDGIIAWYLPLNDGNGTTAKDNISEEELEGPAAIDITAGATCTFILSGLITNRELSNVQMPEDNSFMFFIKTSTTTGETINVGDPTGNRIIMTAESGVNNTFIDSNGTVNAGTYTASQAAQMCACIVDRKEGTVSFREGVNGETLVGESELAADGVFSPSTIEMSSASNTLPLSYGLGLMVFPKGVPTNIDAMLAYISAELTANRKLQWTNSVVSGYVL